MGTLKTKIQLEVLVYLWRNCNDVERTVQPAQHSALCGHHQDFPRCWIKHPWQNLGIWWHVEVSFILGLVVSTYLLHCCPVEQCCWVRVQQQEVCNPNAEVARPPVCFSGLPHRHIRLPLLLGSSPLQRRVDLSTQSGQVLPMVR